jgi:multiple sugar transport system substrate-binding protein
MKYSKNVDAAREFLMYLMAPEQYSPWLDSGLGYDVGVLHEWDEHPVWQKDPKILAYRDAVTGGTGRWPGWPGPAKAAAARVRNDYIIVDLFAKACSREFTPEEAVKWATGQLERRYQS